MPEVCLRERVCVRPCDVSASDSSLAHVKSVVSRSSNKPFSERHFTVSPSAGSGTYSDQNTGTFSLLALAPDDGIKKL